MHHQERLLCQETLGGLNLMIRQDRFPKQTKLTKHIQEQFLKPLILCLCLTLNSGAGSREVVDSIYWTNTKNKNARITSMEYTLL